MSREDSQFKSQWNAGATTVIRVPVRFKQQTLDYVRTLDNGIPKPKRRTTMHGKPIYYRDAKTILNEKSEFQKKRLCDGLTFSMGDACAFSCTFCYVESAMIKLFKRNRGESHQFIKDGESFQDVVMRRKNALQILERELKFKNGNLRFPDSRDKRVVFSSTSVDIAANMELVRETIEACKLILKNTHWQIRLLSKSSLLKHVAMGIPKRYKHRMIYGFSTGTLDNGISNAIEVGTALVSQRIKALHWLQDHDFRTFGMICPSLPQVNYDKFAQAMARGIRPNKCEHIWAEVVNARGKSFDKTCDALKRAGYNDEAKALQKAASDHEYHEEYSRKTFLAHRAVFGKNLRYLQYVTVKTKPWWEKYANDGAVLLGKEKSA